MIAPIFLSASEPSPERDRQYWPGNLLHIREAVRAFCAHILPHYPLVYGGHPAITPMVNQIAARMNLQPREEEEESKDQAKDRDKKQKPPPQKILMYRSNLYINPPDPLIQELPDPLTDVFFMPAKDMVVTPAHQKDGKLEEKDDKLEAGRNGRRNASLLRMRYEMLGRPGPYPLHPDFKGTADRLGSIRRREMGTYEFSAAIFIGGMEGVEKEFNIFRSFHPTTPAYPIASTGSACKDLFGRVESLLTSEQAKELAQEAAYSLVMQSLLPIPSAETRGEKDTAPWPADPVAQDATTHMDPDKLDGPRPSPPAAPHPMTG